MARFEPLDPSRAGRDLQRRHARGRVLPRGAAPRAGHAPMRSSGAYPKVLRRVGGYNLDAFVDPDRAPFNLAQARSSAPKGTLAVVLEAKVSLVPLPAAKAVLAIQFDGSARSARGHAGDPRASPVGRRGDGPLHPRQHASRTPHSNACAGRSSTATRGAPVRRVLRRRAEDLPPRLDALERDLTARRFGYRYHRAIDAGGAGADLERCAKRRSACRWR